MKKSLTTLMPLLAWFLIVGCSSGTPTGKLSGTVSFDKKPVNVGRLTVVTEDGKNPISTWVKVDGTYVFEQAPVGKVKLAYDLPQMDDSNQNQLPPDKKGGGPKDMGGMKDKLPPSPEGKESLTDEQRKMAKLLETSLPPHYRSWQNSGLTATVEAGKDNTYEVVMKPK